MYTLLKPAELEVDASLPPLPYAPFNEDAFSHMTERASKVVFTVLHKIIRTIPKGKGYKDIGLDVLNKYLGHKVNTKEEALVEKLSNELGSALTEEMARFWRLDKTQKDDPNPIQDAQAALKDYEYALSHHKVTPEGVKSGPSLKTLTVAPIHVPWSDNLRTIPGFTKAQDFPAVQKNTIRLNPKNTPFDKIVFKEDKHHKVTPTALKVTPSSPPTLIFAKAKKTYVPKQMEHDPRPNYGLKRKMFHALQYKMRGPSTKLKAFLDKHNIPHESVIVPSLYDRIIVQYYVGPWKRRKNPDKPFQVTAFIRGELAYDNIFSTQKEAEKAVRVWAKNILKSRSSMQGWMNFSYNKRKFGLSPDKVAKILKVLDEGKRYKMPRTEGIYLIYRGESPRVRNSGLVRGALEALRKKLQEATKNYEVAKAAMDKAKPEDKLEKRSVVIKMKKELKEAQDKYDLAQDGAKIDREVAERVAPMKVKAPIKGFIRLIESRE